MEPNEIRLAKLRGLAKAEQDKQKGIADAKRAEFENWREWLKGFIKRVPTLCQYCALLRTANIDMPVVSYNRGYKYDGTLTFKYVHWMNGVIGIGLEDPNTGGCGTRKAILGPDASWVYSECGVKPALEKGAGDSDDERSLVRFATMASEWEKQLLALIDKL